MIRRSFLQMALAVVAAPFGLVRSKSDDVLGGSLSSKEKDKQYSAPVILRLEDGTVVHARAFGNTMSYRQPIEKQYDIGDKKIYYHVLGTEVEFDRLEFDYDYMAVDLSETKHLRDLARCKIASVEVPYIELPTACVVIDHEHPSGRIHMTPGEKTIQARTKMDLSMTIKNPSMTFSAARKELYRFTLSNVLFSNVRG